MIKSEITSPPTSLYNCIAWVLGDQDTWFDPGQGYYWPKEIPRSKSLDIIIKLFNSFGFQRCNDSRFEEGVQKIALYVNQEGYVLHASRQINSNLWTSKLGISFDVSHPFVEKWDQSMYSGNIEHVTSYGELAAILKK